MDLPATDTHDATASHNADHCRNHDAGSQVYCNWSHTAVYCAAVQAGPGRTPGCGRREASVLYTDKVLQCRQCGAEFVFTAGEQEFYAAKGLVNQPARCPDCRAARRARLNGGGELGARRE